MQNELHRKQTLLRRVAALTAATTTWLVVSPAIALASPANRPVTPRGHSRALSVSEMARIFGARQSAGIVGGGGSNSIGGIEAPAADGSGGAEPWQGASPASGNKLTQRPVVSWTQRGGLPVAFTLSHSSIGKTNGTVGNKWTHSFNVYLVLGSGNGTGGAGGGGDQLGFAPKQGRVHFSDAHSHIPTAAFTAAASSSVGTGAASVQLVTGDGRGETFTQNVDGSYSATAGIWDNLTANADGSYTLTKKDLTVWTFNAAGLLQSIADKNGNTAILAYNATNQLQSVTDATGRQLAFAWDSSNTHIVSVTDPMNHVWNLAYDGSNNLASITDPSANGTQYATSFVYDAASHITAVTDRNGKAWTNTYDGTGRVLTETTPLNQTTSYAYAASGKVVTDPRGNSVTYSFDSNGNLASVKDEAGYTESYTYDASHDKTGVTDKRGKAWAFTYDGRGNELTAKNPLGQSWTDTYNSKNEILTETSPLGYTTTDAYDSKGNLISVSNALSQTTSYTVNSYGLVSAKTDSRGHQTTYAYSAAGDLSGVTTPGGKTSQFFSDSLGHRLYKSDASGRSETFNYDNLGRNTAAAVFSNDDPYGQALGHQYDAENHLTWFRDTISHVATARTFDAQGRLTGESSSGGANNNATTYTWDGSAAATAGRLVGVTDAAGQTTAYGYTVRGQLATVSNATGTTAYTYGNAGEELTITNANSTTVTKTYDDAGQLAKVVNKAANGTTLSSFAYTYRADGKKSSVTEGDGSTVAYTYDAAGRLTGELRTGAAAYSASYTLDSEGNRVNQTINGATTTLTYDGDDALLSASSTNGGLNDSYTYDGAGNQTSRTLNGVTYQLKYNQAGQLGSITGGQGGTIQTSFVYDTMGRRISRTSQGVTTTFVKVGDANGGIVLNEEQSGNVTASYTYGNGLLAKGGDTYLSDGQGSTRQVTSSSGAVTSSSTLDGFGNTVAATGTQPTYGYNGQAGYRSDGDAGLQQVGARYYDAQVGMFTTRDTELDQKPYQYCEHDPVNDTDPDGHKPISGGGNTGRVHFGEFYVIIYYTYVYDTSTGNADVTITGYELGLDGGGNKHRVKPRFTFKIYSDNTKGNPGGGAGVGFNY